MNSEASSRDVSGEYSFDPLAATFLEALGWGALLALLALQVPWTKQLFADFGVDLPEAAVVVFAISDFVVHFVVWLVPLGLVVLFAINAFAFGAIRSTWGRVLWTALMSLLPLLLGAGTFAILQPLVLDLKQQLI